MRSKMKNRFVASVILSAFIMTNTMMSTSALDNLYGAGSKPQIRTTEGVVSMDDVAEVEIPNGDSIVNLSLRDADTIQVLRMFADQAGMNVIFADGIDSTVTLDLVDIPLKDALNLVIRTKGLFYDVKANTLVVSPKGSALKMADRTKNITVIPIKYVNAVAISDFLNTSVFGPKGNSINPNVTSGLIVATNPATNDIIITGTDADVAIARRVVEQFDKKPAVTTFKVNHTTPAEMAKAVCGSLFPSMTFIKDDDEGSDSGGAAGIPTGFASDSDSGSDSGSSGGGAGLSISGGHLACALATWQKTEETTEGGGDDSSGDGKETTFNLSSLRLLNMSVSYFPALGTVQLVGGSESQIEMVREYIAENDKKTPQAYIEMQIISLSETGSKEFNNSWQYYSKNFSFNADSNGFSTQTLHPIFFAGHGYSTYKMTEFPFEKNGYYTKYSGSPTLVYAVKYLLSTSKGRVLANPKIIATNGQTSTIDLTSDYVSKVTTQYLDSSSYASQVQKEYELGQDNGIKVEVTPFISPDGYVTLDLKPHYSTIKDRVYSTSEDGSANDIVATLLQRRDLELKGVRIKDGETLVIGGLIQETESKTVSKIPFLGDIPVIGAFFRSTNTSKEKEELVILITPQIIVDTEDAIAEDNTL